MAINNSVHNITLTQNRFTCTNCKHSLPCNSPTLRDWLKTGCHADHSVTLAPTPYSGSVQIGRQSSHVSHSLYTYRGIVYCNNCGSMAATSRLGNLAHSCQELKGHGKSVLAKIRSGQLPNHMGAWPDEEVSRPSSVIPSAIPFTLSLPPEGV